MQRKLMVAAMCLSLSCLTLACGGNAGRIAEPELGPTAGAEGLPALDGLPQPKEALAMAAPGFHKVDHLSPLARANATPLMGSYQLDNAANILTFVMYGVYGFDGDNFPCSVKLNVGDGGGDFYVAFSDFTASKWEIAGPFNSDGEFGIPGVDEHSDPAAFVSPDKFHYFAVIAAPGSLMYIDGIELGVSGGDNAPKPVKFLDGSGGPNGFIVTWYPSLSANDPDFAGYIVERAPLFGGSFSPLATEPALPCAFNDATAVLDTLYRYRVAAYDTSGNSASGPSFTFGPETGEEADPVVVYSGIPDGPLTGPASITVDLSASYDPEGEGVTVYEAGYYTSSGYTMFPGPGVPMTLQPGCYLIIMNVECADGRNGRAYRYLKVYPEWKPDSVVVRATEPNGTWKEPRLFGYVGGKQPGDGRITLAGFDITLPGLGIQHYDGAGGFELFRAPQIEFIAGIGEPIVDGENLVFPVSTPFDFYAVGFDGTKVNTQSVVETTNSYGVAINKDLSGHAWLAYGSVNGPNTDIKVDGSLFGGGRFTLATVPIAASVIDVETDPASGHLWVFYADGVGIACAEFDPATNTPLGTTPLNGGNLFKADAEINPENSRIGVMFNLDNHIYYREQDGMGGWTAAVEIDNSLLNNPLSDMEPSASGKLNAYFSLASGQAHRYEYSGGVWSMVNISSFSADSGYAAAILPIAGTGDMSAVDLCSDGVIRLARMKADGTDSVFASIDSAVGQGFEMHGAAGTDALHLTWTRPFDIGVPSHCLSLSSPNQGAAWSDAPMYGANTGLNIAGTGDGEVYATGFLAGVSTLYYWDQMLGNFVNDAALPSIADHRPLLGTEFYGSTIVFGVWDDGGATYHIIDGQHGAYNPDSPFLPSMTPVWDGVLNNSPMGPSIVGLADSTVDKPARVMLFPGSPIGDIFGVSMLEGQRSSYGKFSTLGRTVSTGVAMGGFSPDEQIIKCSLFAQGNIASPVRYTAKYYETTEAFEYPIGSFDLSGEFRNTVSTATANGMTVVNLAASIDGKQSYFEWSNLGSWEQLDLPPGLNNMTQPLLIVGRDGRWHLVYRDWKTDAIMCRSTM